MFNPTNPTDIDAFEPPPGAPAYRHFNNYNATATLDADGNPDVYQPEFEAFNYEHKVIDIYVKEGWSYVVWNFYNNYTINDFRVQMYYVNADQTRQKSKTFKFLNYYYDHDDYTTIIGA